MAFSKQTKCPKCGEPCSPLKNTCPVCGAKIQKPSGRTAASSDSVRRGTPQNAQAQSGTRWQLLIGVCLVIAVIVAVIVLITTSLQGDYDTPVTPTPSQEVAATPTPTPTATPTPTPAVEWVKITYAGEERTEFAMNAGGTVQLGTSHFPIEVEGTVTWSSENSEICTVDDTGLVTGVAAGVTNVTATLYGQTVKCKVYVS